MEEYHYLFKILLLGDSNVGKSCLLARFADDSYTDDHHTTIGVDFKVKTIEVGGKITKLQLWDTAGQERYKTIVSSYYRGAHGLLVLFDITDSSSFSHVEMWLEEARKFGCDNVTRVLVGTKSDMEERRLVSRALATQLADRLGMKYIETSAKTASNVSEIFYSLALSLKEKNAPSLKDERLVIHRPQWAPRAPTSTCC